MTLLDVVNFGRVTTQSPEGAQGSWLGSVIGGKHFTRLSQVPQVDRVAVSRLPACDVVGCHLTLAGFLGNPLRGFRFMAGKAIVISTSQHPTTPQVGPCCS